MPLDGRRLQMLDAMGVTAWRVRDESAPGLSNRSSAHRADAHAPAHLRKAAESGEDREISGLDWADLESVAASCRACRLCDGRNQVVFGTGNREARWLIIGEAPGADEDAQGEPFVGRAGQLLNAMIRATGASRDQLYIANIVKCRPPSNRNPRPEEANACRPFLLRQIELIGPDLILAVGRVAANNLLGNDETLGRLRGQIYPFGPGKIPLVVTYHPAYLLRKPSEKVKAWADLRLAMGIASPKTA